MDSSTVKDLGNYRVVQQLGSNTHSRIYRVSSDARPDQELMLKIATGVGYNGHLDREAFLLTTMRENALRLEAEYAHTHPGAGTLHYQIGFPELVETFQAPDQDNRRVIILGFDATNTIGDLAPVRLILSRDRVRVDPKTSAWFLGKLLKIIAFAHSQTISIGDLTAENILVIREHHLVSVFDWTKAKLYNVELPKELVRGEIRAATLLAISLLGGNPNSGEIPMSDQLTDQTYQTLLTGMLSGAYSDASIAHSAFYKTVEALWGRKFHPYTTFPID